MALIGIAAQCIFRANYHLILGLSFVETSPGLSCNSQDSSYHGQGLWLRGLTQEKNTASPGQPCIRKRRQAGVGLTGFFACLFSSVLAPD